MSSSKYTPGELWEFLDGPRLIDGSDLNWNFNLLAAGESGGIVILPSGTTSYTVQQSDRTLLVDATAGNVTINLLDAADFVQSQLNIKKNDLTTHKVSIVPILGDTVDLLSTHADPCVLATPLESVSLVSDLVSNWPIL